MNTKNKRNIKTLLILLSIVALCFSFTSCTTMTSQNTTIRAGLNTEPITLDPRFAVDTDSITVILQLYEGLATFTPEGTIVPAGAVSWDISNNGLTYTFHLRENAKWSNGDPVTAQDYLYAWQTTLTPDIKTPNPYAANLYCIKNAKAVHTKQKKPDELGIKVLDEKTFSVVLEQQTPYFLSLLTTPMFFPVHNGSADDTNTSAADTLTNGPYKVTRWQHHIKMELAKNDYYWDSQHVITPKLAFLISDSASTRLSLFENNQLDIFLSPPNVDILRLKKEGKLQITPILSTYFYYLNTTKPPFNNVNVRKALTLAINRSEIIKNILKGEQKPALAFVPYGLYNGNTNNDFRTIGGNYFSDNDVNTAKKLLAEAGYADGQNFPAVTILYDISEENQAIASDIQSMWKKNLNIDVNLVSQEWKTFSQSVNKMDYDIARARWIADFPDPFSFLALFDSDLTPTKSGWQNKEFNQLLKNANENNDVNSRISMLHTAENILMQDFPLIPIFFYNNIFCSSSHLKGVEHNSLGQIYYRHAYKE